MSNKDQERRVRCIEVVSTTIGPWKQSGQLSVTEHIALILKEAKNLHDWVVGPEEKTTAEP